MKVKGLLLLLLSIAMTISCDELLELIKGIMDTENTGLDFFVNLPAKIGASAAAAIEAAAPGDIKWWY